MWEKEKMLVTSIFLLLPTIFFKGSLENRQTCGKCFIIGPFPACQGPVYLTINHLPNKKILKVNKFKAFADDKLNMAKMMVSLFEREENTVGNDITSIFLLFSSVFSKAFFRFVNPFPNKPFFYGFAGQVF